MSSRQEELDRDRFPTLLRGVSALVLMLPSVAALAREALPTIDVAGEAKPSSARDAFRPAEKEIGYTRSSTFSATKTEAPLLDTPVAVQIIPHEVIVDEQVLNTMEAVKNVSGVQSSPGTYYDRYLIRGFDMAATWRNGLKLQSLIGGEEIAFTDRVEIVKGPASVLYWPPRARRIRQCRDQATAGGVQGGGRDEVRQLGIVAHHRGYNRPRECRENSALPRHGRI